MFFQELRLSLASGLCDRSVGRGASEREFRASEKDEDNDRLKIVFYARISREAEVVSR